MEYQTQVADDTARQSDAARRTRRLRGAWRGAWLTPRRFAIVIFITVLLLNTMGYGVVWGYNAYSVQKAARADLNVRLAHLEALGAGGKALTPAGLEQAQIELTGVDHDLRQLQALLPFGDVTPIPQEASLNHLLSLGIDSVDAGLAGVQVAQTLSPSLAALLFSVTHGTQTPPAGAAPLTLTRVADAQRALAVAKADWAAAVAERQQISPGALQSLGDPRVSKLLTSFDKYAPTVSLLLENSSAALDWSPASLGLATPFHLLFFDMDTDELRPTGGFLGAYAQLTMSKGLLTSGIHLHDIYSLDCPKSYCIPRAVPSEFSWFTISNGVFGVRDSNLNPDFPTFAGLASKLYQQDTGTRIDAVVAITPVVIADLLRATGPLTVPQFNVTVTADNLNTMIHYYHQHPEITRSLGINYTALGSTVNKAFDALLSHAFLTRLTALNTGQLKELGSLLIPAFASKDIQVFVNDTRLQKLLEQLGGTGAVLSPSYDNLMVVDANDGASYANADMQETISDAVTLDATGGATHKLTVSYFYRDTSHLYEQQSYYDDFVRVIVTRSVTHVSMSGPCTPKRTTQAQHFVFGCQLHLARGGRATVTFSWRTPHAFSVGASATYRLLIQRQAGARVNWQVSVAPPSGQAVLVQGNAMRVVNGRAVWSANPLLTNTTLTTMVG